VLALAAGLLGFDVLLQTSLLLLWLSSSMKLAQELETNTFFILHSHLFPALSIFNLCTLPSVARRE